MRKLLLVLLALSLLGSGADAAFAQPSPYLGTWGGPITHLSHVSSACSGSPSCPPAPVLGICDSDYSWTATVNEQGFMVLDTGPGITTCRSAADGSVTGSFPTAMFRLTGTLSATGALNVPASTSSTSGTSIVCEAYTLQFSLAPPGMSGVSRCSYSKPDDPRGGALWTDTGSFSNSFAGARTSRELPLPPPFPMTVTSNITATSASASAQIQYRPQDVGTQGSVYVFALAPATRVAGGQAADALVMGAAKGGRKADVPVACVLSQLNASGQMVAVTSSNLGAFLTGVLSAQGATVSILNNVPTGNVAGATFFVGYGATGQSMINSGVNRAAVTVPGSLTCEPKKPQTGWWWNPAEDGRGYSIEVRGNNMFFASFLYDASGRSAWYVSTGPASLEGSLYNGDLLAAHGGQTLGGAYPGAPTLDRLGQVTLTFDSETTGTLVWPGGTVPIQRFPIIPNGLALAAAPNQPESGWWWNEAESGRGFFMEWQGGTLDIAGYMYDDAGNPVWYLTVGTMTTPGGTTFTGNWWAYEGGMPLNGPWRQNRRASDNVAPVTVQFSGPDTALITLPNGRTAPLKRHRF